MSLSYLSGMESDYLGLAEVRPRRRRPRMNRPGRFTINPEQRAERIKAVMAIRQARQEARRAKRAQQIARMQTAAANEATQQALTADIGRRKNRQERQQAREQKREAQKQQKEAKRAQRQAKAQTRKATRAAAKAQRQVKAVQRRAARQQAAATRRAAATQRRAARQTARQERVMSRAATRAVRQAARQDRAAARRAAVPAPLIRRKAPAPAPIIEEIEEMQIEEFEPEEFEEEEPIQDDADIFENSTDDADYEADSMEGDYLGLDQLGNRRTARKAKRAARKTARKAKRATKKTARKAKRTARGGSVLKKVALAPARAAFMIILRLNVLKTASKIAAGYKRNPDAVRKFAARFGFKWQNFAQAVSKGSKTQISGFGELSAAAALTAAAPIIAALPALFRALGVKVDKQTADAARTAQTASEENADTAEDAEARDEGRPSRAGFKLSTPVLLAGAAAAFLIFNRK